VHESATLPVPPPEESASAANLEATFAQLERDFTELDKQAKALAASVHAAGRAASFGDVRKLYKTVHAAKAAMLSVEPELDRLSRVLTRDFGAELRDGSFAQEILETASRASLRGVRLVHGSIFSFPVIVVPKPEDFTLRFGKRRWTALRPSAVVNELLRLRKQKPTGGAALAKFLDALEHAFVIVGGGDFGHGVPIRKIYEELVPLPGQSTEYAEIDFILDLYALERSGKLVSSSGRHISFPASTSTTGRSVIRIATEDGQEKLYSSLRFD
jgi:hypothetical protein